MLFRVSPISSSLLVKLAALVLCAASLSCADGSRADGAPIDDRVIDRELQRAAADALAGADGTIAVIDAQTGRIRTIVNPDAARDSTLAPGSTAKPFVALAALEADFIRAETPLACRAPFRHRNADINCTHAPAQPGFALADALANSCNYFFATLGERVGVARLGAALAPFGLRGGESQGSSGDATSLALGDGSNVRVTPLRLLAAYAALANGGRLLAPVAGDAQGFIKREEARLNIAAGHRETLLRGLRATVTRGTAADAGLDALPLRVYGKTGTATDPGGLHTHGWFVGFAAGADGAHEEQGSITARPTDASTNDPVVAAEDVRLAFVVLKRDARGSDAARIARPILDVYARLTRERRTAERAASAQGRDDAAQTIRVRRVREASTLPVDLEAYVSGVLAAESSTETNLEALKAQAIVSRTYALHNRERHRADGYDLCDLTHCQRFVVPRRGERAEFYDLVARATEETAGDVLLDRAGAPAEVYFSAACGGMIADASDLWERRLAPAHLRGRPDPNCAAEDSYEWTTTIRAADLARALAGDTATDVGAAATDVRILRRDRTHRATLIEVAGDRRVRLRGSDFQTRVGRALGWNTIKSLSFDVRRTGGGYTFRGRGFGHGLGLCQTGAGRMAVYSDAREILAHYLPGTTIGKITHAMRRDARVDSTPRDERRAARPFTTPPDARLYRTLSRGAIRVRYTPKTPAQDARSVLDLLGAAHDRLAATLARAGQTADAPVDVYIHDSAGDFSVATNRPAWVAAATRGSRIDLQPVNILRRRGALARTLAHEHAHAIIEQLGGGRTPLWLAEGLAIHVAREGDRFTDRRPAALAPDELDRRLAAATSAAELAALYAAAYLETRRLIGSQGEIAVWKTVAGSRNV